MTVLPACVLPESVGVGDTSVSEMIPCRSREDRVTKYVFHINQSYLANTTRDNRWHVPDKWRWFVLKCLDEKQTCGLVPSKVLIIFLTELLDLLSGIVFPFLEPLGSSKLKVSLTPLCGNESLEAFLNRGSTFIPDNTALSCKSSSDKLLRSLDRSAPLLWMLEIFSMSRLDNGLSNKFGSCR
jgi:hypothetical protein